MVRAPRKQLRGLQDSPPGSQQHHHGTPESLRPMLGDLRGAGVYPHSLDPTLFARELGKVLGGPDCREVTVRVKVPPPPQALCWMICDIAWAQG